MADDLTPDSFDTENVLDKHFAGKVSDAPATSPESKDEVAAPPVTPAPAKPGEGTPPAVPAPAKTDEGTPPASPLPEEIAALAGDKPADGTPTPPAPAPVEPSPALAKIDAVQLSPHAQPRTAESFATVKTLAKEEIGRLSGEVGTLRARLSDLEKTPKGDALSEADRKELVSLREFRAGIQLRGDPAFVEKFEKPLSDLEADFYRRLETAGATPENIDAIKKLGGIDKVDVEALLAKVAPSDRRALDAILRRRDDIRLDRDSTSGKSEEALRKAAEEYRKERESATAKETETVVRGFGQYVNGVADLQTYPVPAGADEKTRQQIEAANKQITGIIRDAEAMARRSDPDTRAQLATLAALSVVHRLRSAGLRSALVSAREGLAAEQKARADEVAALQKQLDTLKGASRIGGAPRDLLKPSEAPRSVELPMGAPATAAFEAYEQANRIRG